MAVKIITADTTTPADLEYAWLMTRTYLMDCAKDKHEISKCHTDELNGAIRAGVEHLAVKRCVEGRVCDARLPLDALDHAIRYVDEHLDAKLKWDEIEIYRASDNQPINARTVLRGITRGVIGHQIGSGRGNTETIIAGTIGGTL